MTRYDWMTKIAEEHPDDFNKKLVSEYKKYDKRQKQIIEELTNKVKKLEIKVGQLNSFIDEITEGNTIVISREKHEKQIRMLNLYRSDIVRLEKLLLHALYPKYSNLNIPQKYINKISEILKEITDI